MSVSVKQSYPKFIFILDQVLYRLLPKLNDTHKSAPPAPENLQSIADSYRHYDAPYPETREACFPQVFASRITRSIDVRMDDHPGPLLLRNKTL